MGFLSKLLGITPTPVGLAAPVAQRECHLYLLLREPVRPTEEEMHNAAVRAWNHPFPGDPSAWDVHYHELIRDLWTIRFGDHSLSVSYHKTIEFDDDQATDRLPHIRHRKLWPPHTSRLSLYFGPRLDAVNVPEQTAVICRLALQLVNDNCAGIYSTLEQHALPAGPEMLEYLREKASHAPPNANVA